eukprot:scaffold200130_cov13-Tisochrysis_lutea.AAC.1
METDTPVLEHVINKPLAFPFHIHVYLGTCLTRMNGVCSAPRNTPGMMGASFTMDAMARFRPFLPALSSQ